jgi:hypothetical protein
MGTTLVKLGKQGVNIRSAEFARGVRDTLAAMTPGERSLLRARMLFDLREYRELEKEGCAGTQPRS